MFCIGYLKFILYNLYLYINTIYNRKYYFNLLFAYFKQSIILDKTFININKTVYIIDIKKIYIII